MSMIDLGKMRDSYEDCGVEVANPKKKEKYYPSSYIDDIENLDVDSLEMDKDIEIKAMIRIKSATKHIRKDNKENKDVEEGTDLNFEIRSIDFAPGFKPKKKENMDLQDAIEEGLKK